MEKYDHSNQFKHDMLLNKNFNMDLNKTILKNRTDSKKYHKNIQHQKRFSLRINNMSDIDMKFINIDSNLTSENRKNDKNLISTKVNNSSHQNRYSSSYKFSQINSSKNFFNPKMEISKNQTFTNRKKSIEKIDIFNNKKSNYDFDSNSTIYSNNLINKDFQIYESDKNLYNSNVNENSSENISNLTSINNKIFTKKFNFLNESNRENKLHSNSSLNNSNKKIKISNLYSNPSFYKNRNPKNVKNINIYSTSNDNSSLNNNFVDNVLYDFSDNSKKKLTNNNNNSFVSRPIHSIRHSIGSFDSRTDLSNSLIIAYKKENYKTNKNTNKQIKLCQNNKKKLKLKKNDVQNLKNFFKIKEINYKLNKSQLKNDNKIFISSIIESANPKDIFLKLSDKNNHYNSSKTPFKSCLKSKLKKNKKLKSVLVNEKMNKINFVDSLKIFNLDLSKKSRKEYNNMRRFGHTIDSIDSQLLKLKKLTKNKSAELKNRGLMKRREHEVNL